MVFIDSQKNVIPIVNQDAVKGFAGEHVQLKGKIANGSLTITAGSIKKLAS
jgi:NOL1/NOP2/fmu family ribosome biogenesis protein